MYSNDREEALNTTIPCLQDMKHYEKCQKTLIVDGKTNLQIPEWKIIQVPRLHNKFCWGKMWDAGVASAKYPKILYLDSDRLLPKCLLEKTLDALEPYSFVFTSKHFLLLEKIPLEICKEFLEKEKIINELTGKLKFEHRHAKPLYGPGKNVMSGSVAFHKSTYLELGGVDHWYCGSGAYADSDFHLQAAICGCKFIDLGLIELHYHHPKLDTNGLLGLDNYIYYCKKWGLPMSFAMGLAMTIGVEKPREYVQTKNQWLSTYFKST